MEPLHVGPTAAQFGKKQKNNFMKVINYHPHQPSDPAPLPTYKSEGLVQSSHASLHHQLKLLLPIPPHHMWHPLQIVSVPRIFRRTATSSNLSPAPSQHPRTLTV